MGTEQLREPLLGTLYHRKFSEAGKLLLVGSQPLSGCTCSPGTVGRQTQKTQHLGTSGRADAPHAAQKGKQRPKRKEVYAGRSHVHRGNQELQDEDTGWLQPYDLSSSSSSSSSSFLSLPFFLLPPHLPPPPSISLPTPLPPLFPLPLLVQV